MKKMFFAALLVSLTAPAFAQRDALIDHTDRWNLNTRFDANYSEFDNDGGILGGLSVGGLLNDSLGFGIRGRVLVDDIEGEKTGVIEKMDLWYAGAYVEYVSSRAENLLYWSFDLFAGGGKIENAFSDSDMIVIEPGLNAWVNITETLMLGLGASYRLVEDVELGNADGGDFSGAAGTLSLRFTQF